MLLSTDMTILQANRALSNILNVFTLQYFEQKIFLKPQMVI